MLNTNDSDKESDDINATKSSKDCTKKQLSFIQEIDQGSETKDHSSKVKDKDNLRDSSENFVTKKKNFRRNGAATKNSNCVDEPMQLGNDLNHIPSDSTTKKSGIKDDNKQDDEINNTHHVDKTGCSTQLSQQGPRNAENCVEKSMHKSYDHNHGSSELKTKKSGDKGENTGEKDNNQAVKKTGVGKQEQSKQGGKKRRKLLSKDHTFTSLMITATEEDTLADVGLEGRSLNCFEGVDYNFIKCPPSVSSLLCLTSLSLDIDERSLFCNP